MWYGSLGDNLRKMTGRIHTCATRSLNVLKLIQVGEGRVAVRLLIEFKLFFTELASLYARSVANQLDSLIILRCGVYILICLGRMHLRPSVHWHLVYYIMCYRGT